MTPPQTVRLVSLLLVGVLVLSETAGAQTVTRLFTGYVLESGTDEPLPGATVYLPASGDGAATNAYGRFVLATSAPDTTRAVISFVGYAARTLSLADLVRLDADASGAVRVRLARDSLGLGEVSVRARRTGALASGPPAIQIAEAERLPALLGEVDPVRVQQLLPGVAGGVEGTSGLHVRGGSPDQSLLLLDGVPVYNASHLFGFFSTFNPAAVKSVDLLRGGIPARYGGRLAAVLDVRTREGSGGARARELSVGLASAHARYEGPLGRGATFALAGRQTYAGLLVRPFMPSDDRAGYGFTDLNGTLSFQPSPRDRVFVSGYFGRDAFTAFYENAGLRETGRLAWGNTAATARWTRELSPRAFAEAALVASRYGVDIGAITVDDLAGGEERRGEVRYLSGLADLGARASVEALGLRAPLGPFRVVGLRAGGDGTWHRYRPGEARAQDSTSEPVVRGSEPLAAWEGAAYAEADLRLGARVQATAGLRASGFRAGATELSDPALFASAEPRLALRVDAASWLGVTASLARGTQYLHLLANSGLGLPTDLWLPATARVGPERGWSATLGTDLAFGAGTSLSVEGYARTMTGLVDYRDGAGVFSTARGDWETQVARGRGRAYGAEVLLRHDGPRTSAWAAYTLSRSERLFDGTQSGGASGDVLNGGAWFPYRYDRTHDVALVATRVLKRGVEASATWTYGTGNALTLPVGRASAFEVVPGLGYAYDIDPADDELEVYSERGAFRAPAAHRLDISFSFMRRLGREDRFERRITLGLYNVYSRANPLYIALRRTYERVLVEEPTGTRGIRIARGAELRRYGLLPILPAISYRLRW